MCAYYLQNIILFYLLWKLQLRCNSMKTQMHQGLQIDPSSIKILVST